MLALDAFLTGEYHAPERKTPAPDPNIGFFACFNRTLLAQRVHDVLTGIGYAHVRPGTKKVYLVGMDDAGIWCLLARGLAGDAVDRTALERVTLTAAPASAIVCVSSKAQRRQRMCQIG